MGRVEFFRPIYLKLKAAGYITGPLRTLEQVDEIVARYCRDHAIPHSSEDWSALRMHCADFA